MRVGFVVNVFNALNYDIDIFGISPSPTCLDYTYMDENGIPLYGKTHRCRLAGILRKKGAIPHDDYVLSMRIIHMFFNRLNGWVLVKMVGEDKFKRILVELIDPISGQTLNQLLRELSTVYIPYGD
jgi:hypothetical protein